MYFVMNQKKKKASYCWKNLTLLKSLQFSKNASLLLLELMLLLAGLAILIDCLLVNNKWSSPPPIVDHRYFLAGQRYSAIAT